MERSDASTSTADDVTGQPLCVFYFSHPFAVLSPEPPTLLAHPFLNMRPTPAPAPAPAPAPPAATSDCGLPYYLTDAKSVKETVAPRVRRSALDVGPRGGSLSRSMFPTDTWFASTSSSTSHDFAHRVVPHSRILPPLHVPFPAYLVDLSSPEDTWPKKCLNPEKFSLPPIESLSSCGDSRAELQASPQQHRSEGPFEGSCRSRRRGRGRWGRGARGTHGVRKRGVLACLLRSTSKRVRSSERRGAEGGLRAALTTLRRAWPDDAARSRGNQHTSKQHNKVREDDRNRLKVNDEMVEMSRRSHVAALPGRADVSPGLLRRRYSVPETVMRRYCLDQQRSDSECSEAQTCQTPTSAMPSSTKSGVWPDRELVRRSALLRRLWGRVLPRDLPHICARETKSLDGSSSDLHHLSSSISSSRQSQMGIGCATPKRQCLELPYDFYRSEEFKTGLRNDSQDRIEKAKGGKVQQNISIIDTSNILVDSTNKETSKNDLDHLPIDTENDNMTLHHRQTTPKTNNSQFSVQINDTYYTDTDTLSIPETKSNETNCSLEVPFFEHNLSCGNRKDINDLCLDKSVEASTYEVLEIVVSETINSTCLPTVSSDSLVKPSNMNAPLCNQATSGIDEYISNILVGSLNSLTNQLESINAVNSDRKINIVEKEIKVKLQNTGINTIVHLSPMSNNPIIFGNEELCHADGSKDNCSNSVHENVTIREETHSVESNNNATSAETFCDQIVQFDENTNETFLPQHQNVNKAVLYQIQKLFLEELNNLTPNLTITDSKNCEISQIEITNCTNLNLNKSLDSCIKTIGSANKQTKIENTEIISGVGTGNYIQDLQDNIIVPRFTALPHTDSMEVNTSSSDDAGLISSECTSLVDSLDDPNSPRSLLLRRSLNNSRRSELVRSAIDVLDLLPESACTNYSCNTRDKNEAFFVKIKDDCDDVYEKENVVVADHLPEKIKQMLLKRHQKRELRMEFNRRKKGNNLKKQINNHKIKDMYKSKKELDRNSISIMNGILDEVIVKIAQEEYKCMRIKQKPNRIITIKPSEHFTKQNDSRVMTRSGKKMCDMLHFSLDEDTQVQDHEYNHQRVHDKVKLQSPPLRSENKEYNSKRKYHKSEIHDGDKCVEILEILEYIESSNSSTDTHTFEESHNPSCKSKKSRIPIPIYEKIQKKPLINSQEYKNLNKSGTSTDLYSESDSKSGQLIANMLFSAFCDDNNSTGLAFRKINKFGTSKVPARRASIPYQDTYSKANSVRFRRVFDIIPEEKSSVSVESSNEDLCFHRRLSAPTLAENLGPEINQKDKWDTVSKPKKTPNQESPKSKPLKDSKVYYETKTVGTSPLTNENLGIARRKCKLACKTTMTSPGRRSAATSPVQPGAAVAPADVASRAGPKELSRRKKVKVESPSDTRSVFTPLQNVASTVRTIQGEMSDPIIVGGDKRRWEERRRSGGRQGSVRDSHKGSTSSRDRGRSPTGADDNYGRNFRQDHNSDLIVTKSDKQKIRMISLEKREEETIHKSADVPGSRQRGAPCVDSDSESECGGPLAPRWLTASRRRARRVRVTPHAHTSAAENLTDGGGRAGGGWSVTVAGTSRAALPSDLDLRLRFPPPRPASPTLSPSLSNVQECTRRHCEEYGCPQPRPLLPPPAHVPHLARNNSRKLTLTMKKEALDSTILASKSTNKSTDTLPDVEHLNSKNSKSKSSLKKERSHRSSSPHCWLPAGTAPLRERGCGGLSVLGAAIVPELKPRATTMSERDLTRRALRC